MFTTVFALAVVGGSLPLIKNGIEKQDEQNKNPKKQVDPVTAALEAAKTLSLSLPQPIAGHALSKVTTPPSILVPLHTPAPPIQDIQLLVTLLAAGRKHGLKRWKCQSLFVEEDGLDLGVWVGSLDDSSSPDRDESWKKDIAGKIIEKVTDNKTTKGEVSQMVFGQTKIAEAKSDLERLCIQAQPISLPSTIESDDVFQKAFAALDMHVTFRLPPKDGKEAFLLAGRNGETQNWIVTGAATAGAQAPVESETSEERKSSSGETLVERTSEDTESGSRTAYEETEADPEATRENEGGNSRGGAGRGRRGGRRRRRGQVRNSGQQSSASPDVGMTNESRASRQHLHNISQTEEMIQGSGSSEGSSSRGRGRGRGRGTRKGRRRHGNRGNHGDSPVTPTTAAR